MVLSIMAMGIGSDIFIYGCLAVALILNLIAIAQASGFIIAMLLELAAFGIFLFALTVAYFSGFLYSNATGAANPIFAAYFFVALVGSFVYVLFKGVRCYLPSLNCWFAARCAQKSRSDDCPPCSSESSASCSSSSSDSKCTDECGLNVGPFIPDGECSDTVH